MYVLNLCDIDLHLLNFFIDFLDSLNKLSISLDFFQYFIGATINMDGKILLISPLVDWSLQFINGGFSFFMIV